MESEKVENMSVDENVRSKDESDKSITSVDESKAKLSKEELSECYFLPEKSIKQAMSFLTTSVKKRAYVCRHNMINKQRSKMIVDTKLLGHHWKKTYLTALNKAIYNHDWNKLLYILKKSIHWDFNSKIMTFHIYTRALTILLMNHPSSKAQSLLNHYLHMALSCRSDQDKKALYKVMLSITDKLIRHGNVILHDVNENLKLRAEKLLDEPVNKEID